MASATYETTTRTIEETTVVLRLTEGEASSLKGVLDALDYTGTLTSLRDALTNPRPTVAATASDTVEYDGKTYELSAKYRDVDGDTWEFRRDAEDGQVEGRLVGQHYWYPHNTPGHIENDFGPLDRL
ncbi:hypothetical protein ADL27_38530 [Streptomyces sp. NRRL F-6602]|nr:hypothetical protein ADL27_38530 [Streptomyces sp. NRRL F-6602]